RNACGRLCASSSSRSSSRAARARCSATPAAYTLDEGTMLDLPVAPGQQWIAEAWVREPAGVTAAQRAFISIRIYDVGQQTELEFTDSPKLPIDKTWQRRSVTHD